MKIAPALPTRTVSPAAYLAFFFLSQLVLIGFLLYQKTNNEQEHLAALIAKREAEYQHVLLSQARLTQTIFDEVINRPDIVRLVKEAAQLDAPGRQRNRDQLYTMLFPAYERLAKDRVRQIHFHFADGTSFLRLHHASEFGDNLFAARPSVRLANTKKIPVKGFEVGRDFHAFRHVFPLFIDDEHVGSVEIGIPFYLVRMELSELYPSESLFILKKEIADSKLFTQNRNNYIPSAISDNFLTEKADVQKGRTSPADPLLASATIEQINQVVQSELDAQLMAERPFAVVARLAQAAYVITALPVTDTEAKVAGYILYYQRDSSLSELQFSYYLTYGAISLLTLLLMGLNWWSTKKIIGQNTFLQTIIEALPHPFYVVDTNNYTIKLANSLVALDNKWQGRTCHALTHHSEKPCAEAEHSCPIRKVMATKQEVILEHTHRNLAGEERLVEVHGCPIFDEEGNVTQMIEYSIDITARKLADQERERLINDLQNALNDVTQLSGLIPICSSCKSIRDDQGYWQKIERYISERSEAQFSHGICPDCAKKLYPDIDLYPES